MLTPSQIRQFQDEGYLILREFADVGVWEPMRAIAHAELVRAAPPVEYEADVRYPGSPVSRDADGGRTVRRLLRAYDRDPVFRAWARSPAVAAAVLALLPARLAVVQTHHNCVMTKQPRFSSETGWHQDIRYWAYQKPELVTVWLALAEERLDNGCLRLLPGSHRWALPPDLFDERQFLRSDRPEVRSWIEGQVPAQLAPGDMLLFHALTLHAAGRNETGEVKLSLVFTYKDRDNKPVSGTRSAVLPDIPIDV